MPRIIYIVDIFHLTQKKLQSQSSKLQKVKVTRSMGISLGVGLPGYDKNCVLLNVVKLETAGGSQTAQI